MKYLKDGEPFDIYRLHIIDDIQYPVGWFYDPENRAAIGLEEVEDDPVPRYVPSSVTMRQARLALLKVGRLDDVSAAIATLPSPQKEAAQIEWEFSSVVERDREMTTLIAGALGLSGDGLDDLFIEASAL